MSEKILKFENVNKCYGSTEILPNLSFDIHKGEFISLLGPSGCGKTTTLRLIAGLEEPTGGEISIADKVVANNKEFVAPEKRNLGMVFQSYAIWPHLNVFENIAYPLRIRKTPDNTVKEKVLEILDSLQMQGLDKRQPSELSGGQQQRVALGRALIMDPIMLLLDEPLSNLDAKLRLGMREEMKGMQKKYNTTIIYVTHDQDEAFDLSDRIFILNKGKIEQSGSPEEIRANPKTEFVKDFID